MYEYPDADFWIDPNGVPTERRRIGDMDVIVHYEDIPDKDVAVVRGVPCTTTVRTLIDTAICMDHGEWEAMVIDALSRGLFSREEALARTAEPDMLGRAGAHLLRRFLLR